MDIIKLNLGCGHLIIPDAINCDIIKLKGVDLILNLNYCLPFKNNSIDEIICFEVLEHVDNLIGTVRELHRILKTDRLLKIKVPHFTYFGAIADPTHKRQFSWFTFDYFLASHRKNYYFDFGFSSIQKKLLFYQSQTKERYFLWNIPIEYAFNKIPRVYEGSFLKIFPAFMLSVILRK